MSYIELDKMIEAANNHFVKSEDPRNYEFWDNFDFDLTDGQELVITAEKNGEYRYLDANGELGDDPDWASTDKDEQIDIAKAYGFEFCRIQVVNPLYVVVNRESWDVISELDTIEEAREIVAAYVTEDMENDQMEEKEVKELDEYEKFYQILIKISSTGDLKALEE
jgi:hypothetical protein